MLDKGIRGTAEQGKRAEEGLLWMLEALKVAPPDASDLSRVIRTNLAAWMEPTHSLRHLVEEPLSPWSDRCAFHPDGRRIS